MRTILTARWSETGEKIVKLAEEFPEDRYSFRPSAETRTFAEQLRHVAFWNLYAARTLRGEPADGDANELAAAEAPTKATLVARLRESFGDVASAVNKAGTIDAKQADTVMSFLEHNGEHYGQLAVYCRLNGVVPPASR